MHSSVMIYANNIKRRKIVFFDFTSFISREVNGNFECGPLTVWVNEKRVNLLESQVKHLLTF